jgi:hypothetical protein
MDVIEQAVEQRSAGRPFMLVGHQESFWPSAKLAPSEFVSFSAALSPPNRIAQGLETLSRRLLCEDVSWTR